MPNRRLPQACHLFTGDTHTGLNNQEASRFHGNNHETQEVVMKKSKLATILAALTLTTGIAVAGSGSADAALGDQHFILVSTHGSPTWNAHARVTDSAGNEAQKFDRDKTNGGKVRWNFTEIEGGKISIDINGGTGPDFHMKDLPTDRDHCFLISADGSERYTGDNLTGGCTPD
jgi:hypothetical protein